MAVVELNKVIQHLRNALEKQQAAGMLDADLLKRYVERRDEAAFEALVRRHGPMVLGVCRRVLHNLHDAEDAFQATFLVLVRKASTLRSPGMIGNWLYGVAYRTAVHARDAAIKRSAKEAEMVRRTQAAEDIWTDLRLALDQELERLPEKYRAVIVLCDLEGKTRKEVARQLGWAEGTVASRLVRGRGLLAKQLAHHGLALSGGALAAALSQNAASACIPPSMVVSTVKVASLFATGQTAAGVISVKVAALTEAVLKAMLVTKLKIATAVLLLSAFVCYGIGLRSLTGSAAEKSPKNSRDQPAAKEDAKPQAAAPNKDTDDKPVLSGRRHHRADNAAEVPAAEPAKQPQAKLDRFGDPLPEGALARFGTVRLRQGWLVSRVLFSPDGKKLALAGNGRPLGLWDVATGKELHQFHQKDVRADGVAFSPDGALLAEGDVTVRLWDTKTGALRRELPATQESQRAVVFAPDGKVVFSGGHDNLIHLWNAHSGESLGKLEGHTSSVLTLAVTKDGSTLASAGSDRVIRLWDLASRKQIHEIKGLAKKDSYFNQLSFSPDGRWLASAEGEGNAPARVWDVHTGKERFQLGDNSSHSRTVEFSPDGRLIASGHVDGAIHLWNSATGKKVREWCCSPSVRSLAFSPNGKMLATICIWASGPRLWDVATGTEIRPSDTHRSMIQQICLTSDGKSLLSLGHDQQVIEWDLATKTPKRLMEFPFGKTWSGHYYLLSPDGRFLAQTSSADRTVTLIDPQTRKSLRAPLQIAGEPFFSRFSADGKTLAIGCQKGGFYLWNWQGDASARRIETPEKDKVIIHLFTPDGKQLVTGSTNQNNLFVHLWDVATGKRVLSFPGNNGFPVFAIAPDGNWAAGVGYGDRSIHVIDVLNRKEVRTISVPQPANGLAFSPDGQVLAYGEMEGGSIGLLDFATGQLVASFQGQHSGVGQLLFSPDGRSLFSGAGDSTIMHWDATGRGGKRLRFVNLRAAWDALAGDAKDAFSARWDFLESPREAITFFRKHIRPVPVPKSQAFQKLVEALDSESFAERQKASSTIKAMGPSAEPLLRKQLESKNSLEAQRRLQTLHGELMNSSTWRRTQAVLAIVSAITPDDARPFLEELAEGHPDAMLTLKAKQVLDKMNKPRNGEKK